MEAFKTYFFFLSGELPSKGLPSHEILAILNSYNIKIEKIKIFDQVLIITSKTTQNICKIISDRAAYTHLCGELVFQLSDPNFNSIKTKICNIELESIFGETKSFAIRLKKVKTYFPNIVEEQLEREIGGVIKSFYKKKIKVNLDSPEILLLGIFTENIFILGTNIKKIRRNLIRNRSPHTRPFFHPCGLDPFLARAMVNLSEINYKNYIFDPFCGTGTIMIEAALMGFRVIGSDINYRMIRGAILNLKSLDINYYDVIKADARKFYSNSISCIVTDPPYGRASSIYGENLKSMLFGFFSNIIDVLEKTILCILALPSTFKIEDLVMKFEFKIQNQFEYFVHRSLTRNIFILKKM